VNPYRQLPTRLRVLDGIAEQICEYLLEAEWICHDPYRLLGQRSRQQMAACLDLHLLRPNRVIHHQAQIDPLAVQLHLLIGTRAQDVQEIVYEARHESVQALHQRMDLFHQTGMPCRTAQQSHGVWK
jgi:hypothetical protein